MRQAPDPPAGSAIPTATETRGSRAQTASSSLPLQESRFAVGSRNVNPFNVPSAAAKNCSSAAFSPSVRHAYASVHSVGVPAGLASLNEVQSAAAFTTVRARCGRFQSVHLQAAVRERRPIPGIGESEASERSLVIDEELFQRCYFSLIQLVQLDLPAPQWTGAVAVALFRTIDETQRLVLIANVPCRRVLNYRAGLQCWKGGHGQRSFTTSLIELRLSIAFRTAAAMSALWSMNDCESIACTLTVICAGIPPVPLGAPPP